eukprot:jgi/Picsp_1/2999/NSC_01222-R1_hypothetical protein CHLNCDRAFT_138815 [Chlorella variabilis]
MSSSKSAGSNGGSIDVDKLLEESKDALKRIENLEKGHSATGSLTWMQRVQRHVRSHSNHLLQLTLAMGIMGLSIARINEKYAYKERVEDLEKQLEDVRGQLKSEIGAAAAGRQLAATLEGVLGGVGWGKRVKETSIQSSLDMYYSCIGVSGKLSPETDLMAANQVDVSEKDGPSEVQGRPFI